MDALSEMLKVIALDSALYFNAESSDPWCLVSPESRAPSATSHSVAQIASDVGFESKAAPIRAFKREYGLPPARYRRDRAAQRAGAPAAGLKRG